MGTGIVGLFCVILFGGHISVCSRSNQRGVIANFSRDGYCQASEQPLGYLRIFVVPTTFRERYKDGCWAVAFVMHDCWLACTAVANVLAPSFSVVGKASALPSVRVSLLAAEREGEERQEAVR